ncbi:hypothetical protein EVAR_95597_1 [Eumeta japonica]|uniref:Uncharacterized protein n=1 Tax=Eumeta variegata TaxID=151549 RepID=A0A4C1VIQ4_EUMVA|nr:hypothetical protein EVAR_95597_1 [Eumeta japonica]
MNGTTRAEGGASIGAARDRLMLDSYALSPPLGDANEPGAPRCYRRDLRKNYSILKSCVERRRRKKENTTM